MPAEDDQTRLLCAGDPATCERFVREQGLAIYGWLYRLTGRREEVEDLAQDALTAFWESIRRKPPPVAARIWLFSVARNVWRRHCRRAGNVSESQHHALEATPATGPSVLEAMEQEEMLHVLRTAVMELDAEFQEVFALRVWQGWSYADIAAVQDVSADLARWRFFRARQQIRARLGRWFNICENSHDERKA